MARNQLSGSTQIFEGIADWIANKTLVVLAGLICSLLMTSSADAAPKKVALVIGNAAYAGSDRLKNPVADATLTANSLRQLGFTTTLSSDRTLAQLRSDLQTFSLAAKDADIALFFYAGHGIAVENINYLVAVDQQLARLKSLDLKRDGISLRWIESLMAQNHIAVAVLVVDACRNPLMRSGGPQGMVAAANPPHGALTFFSTAPGALANDGAGKNSDFTIAFNRYLAKPELSLMQVVQATQSDVSKVTGDTQIPWVNSGLIGDVRLASGQVLARAPAAATKTAEATPRGSESKPAAPQVQKFWDDNLARLDEQIQYDAMNFDVNSKTVMENRARSGDVMALTTLGLVYATPEQTGIRTTHGGYGLDSSLPTQGGHVLAYHPGRAVTYLSQAAARRFPIAQTILAELLVAAPRGVPRDYQRAETLLQEAADSGYGRARLDLLDLHARQGRISPEALAKELISNSANFKNTLDRRAGATK